MSRCEPRGAVTGRLATAPRHPRKAGLAPAVRPCVDERLIDRNDDLFVRQSTDAGATFEAASRATDAVYYYIDNDSQQGSSNVAASRAIFR